MFENVYILVSISAFLAGGTNEDLTIIGSTDISTDC